jgi:hypothetical protein
LRVREAKPVNEWRVNTQFGHGFDSHKLHFQFSIIFKPAKHFDVRRAFCYLGDFSTWISRSQIIY